MGDVPTEIILNIKAKKKFIFTRYPPHFVSPPSWTLTYNNEDGTIEIKEQYCD